MARVLTIVAGIIGAGVIVAAGLAGGYVWNNTTAFDRSMRPVWRAGFTEQQAMIADHAMNYAEGPDNGPALLLVHGQSTDWKSYAAVLPDLAERYHVYAVDYWGHGGSDRFVEHYSAAALGADLADFVEQVVAEPVLVSGHSSGGHLAAWLGAYGPDSVRGVLLEDPPFFTTTLPRAASTWNYVDLATTSHEFLASGETSWVRYSMEHARMWRFFGDGAEMFREQARDHLADHPEGPVRWWSMPPMVNESFRALPTYDPRFGDAFYRATWDDGWDQAAALSSIDVPATLVHTRVVIGEDGILQAAMGDEEAARARDLLPDGVFHKVETGHNYHGEDPRDYAGQVDALRARSGL